MWDHGVKHSKPECMFCFHKHKAWVECEGSGCGMSIANCLLNKVNQINGGVHLLQVGS